jgi:hypothetical protein
VAVIRIRRPTRLPLTLPLFLLAAFFPQPLLTANPDAPGQHGDRLQAAFDHLFNFEFDAAHRALDRLETEQPRQPMVQSLRCAVYLFSELQRLDLLAAEFFADHGERLKKKDLKPDLALRNRLFEQIERTYDLAGGALQADPDNHEALFAMSMAAGIEGDYQFFVEKKRLGSLKVRKESHGYARRLLEIDPSFVDAYLTTGFYEYFVGDLPFFMRWFIRFDGVDGNKKLGIARLENVAENGRYISSFAKVLLAAIYLREDEPRKTVHLLAELAAQYPRNPLFSRELRKVARDHGLPIPEAAAQNK